MTRFCRPLRAAGFGFLLLGPRFLSAQCSTEHTAVVAPENHIRLVATVLEGRIPVRYGQLLPIEHQAGDLLKAFGYDHFAEDRLAVGQLVHIRQADLADPAVLEPDSSAVVVRWYPDSHGMCQLRTLVDSLPGGSHHVFIAKLRAESLWVRGRPTFDVHPGLFTSLWAQDSTAVESLLFLTRMLPTREAWNTDCRPHVKRLRDNATHLSPMMKSTIHQSMTRFSDRCRESVQRHAWSFDREKTRPVSQELLAVFRAQGCRDEYYSADAAVNGRFTDSGAEQWAFVCEREREGRVLIAILEKEPQIIELARMTGRNWSWSLQAAPANYFEWMDSNDFSDRVSPAPRPRRDVVLLNWDNFPTESLTAHYLSPRGWESVTVRCCRGLD